MMSKIFDRVSEATAARGMMGLRGPKPDPTVIAARMAARQRGWELGLPGYTDLSGRRPPPIIAIGGGKGGVGKSLVSANLAVKLAASGWRVLAIDMDIGGANLHTYFGLPTPTRGLADVVVYGRSSLAVVMVTTNATGVSLVAGGNEEVWGGAAAMDQAAMGRLFESFIEVQEKDLADIILLDLGAGTHGLTLDCYLAAHLGILTVLPEPTSIENAYLFLKTALFRLVRNVGDQLKQEDIALIVRDLLVEPDKARKSGYGDHLRLIGAKYPEFIASLRSAVQSRTLGIAVNQVRSQKDIDVGKSMELIAERYFGFNCRSCGYLNYDEAAWKSLRNRRLLVVDFPHSVLSKRFSELSRLVLSNLGF